MSHELTPQTNVGDFGPYLEPLDRALHAYRGAILIRPQDHAEAVASAVTQAAALESPNPYVTKEMTASVLADLFHKNKEMRVAAAQQAVKDALLAIARHCDVSLTTTDGAA